MTIDTKLVLQQLKAQGLLTKDVLRGMFGDEIPEEILAEVNA